MANFILRPARKEDREKIIEIFTASFGDGEAFVRELIDSAELLSTASCAELDGELRSCMFAFHGIRLGEMRVSYLYALCTEPSYRGRGLGRAVTEYSARRAAEMGADGVFLLAADEGLQRWYMSTMGAVPTAPAAAIRVCPAPFSEKARAISPQEYFFLRRGKWLLPEKLLLAQECVHRHFGGAFLRLDKAWACAEKTEQGILVRELSPSDEDAMLSAVAEYFGVKELYVLTEASAGKPLLFLPPLSPSLPELIPPFPILLD